jgi:monoamine oxidase
MKTISIAGAGLAGMTAGINLARAGLDVEIIEMRSDAGARFHGDFQFFENWSRDENVLDTLRGLNLDLGFPIWPVYAGTAFDERRGATAVNAKPKNRRDSPVGHRIEGDADPGIPKAITPCCGHGTRRLRH